MLALVVWYSTDVSGLTAMIIKAVSNSETSMNLYQTTRHYVSEDSHLFHLLIVNLRKKIILRTTRNYTSLQLIGNIKG
jgi:hypothetical protein